MNTSDRREKILRAESAILDLEKRAAEHVSAADTVNLAQNSLKVVSSKVSNAVTNMNELSSSVSSALAEVRSSGGKLTAAAAQIDAIREEVTNQSQQLTKQTGTRLEGLVQAIREEVAKLSQQSMEHTSLRLESIERLIRSTSEEFNAQVAAANSALSSETEAARKSIAATADDILKHITSYETTSAERTNSHDKVLEKVRLSSQVAVLLNVVTLILVIVGLSMTYLKG